MWLLVMRQVCLNMLWRQQNKPRVAVNAGCDKQHEACGVPCKLGLACGSDMCAVATLEADGHAPCKL